MFIACSCVVRYQEHIAVNPSATLKISKAYQGAERLAQVRSSIGQLDLQLQKLSLALRRKVVDLRIEDSQNLSNANYSDLSLLWHSAVKDTQRRNGINGGDPRSGEEAVYAGFAYP